MNCSYCGAPLPSGAKACPNCGAATSTTPPSNYYSKGGTAPLDATIPASPYPAPQQPPATGYGAANPYASAPFAGQQNAYMPPAPNPNTLDPYGPLTPPTPAPPAYNAQAAGASPYPYTPIPPASMPPGPQEQKPGRRFSTGLIVLLVILIVLLIGGSGGIYYAAVYRPGVEHAQATATAQTHATQTANAQATAAVENPYTHSGTLVFTDPLTANNQARNWDENRNCAFSAGTYEAIAPDPHNSDYCIANNTAFSDFVYEVQMKVLKGDAGGILFRVMNTNPNQYYEFYIGQDSSYSLELVNGDKYSTLLTQNSNPAIHTGLNQTNLVAVVAQRNKITVYVNHQSLGSALDNTYTHGQLGVYAAVYTQITTVSFSNARVWKL
jgi:hypothetical protein